MAFNMTLDQEEIEKAIDIHVRSLVPGLSAETKIGISLSATRGPSGFTAAIDLNPTAILANTKVVEAPVPEAAVEVEEEAKPIVTKPVKVRTSGTRPLNIAAKAAQAKVEPEETSETVVTEETVAEEVISEEQAAAMEADATDLNAPIVEAEQVEEETAGEEAEVQVEVEPEPVPERKSLFSKMTKPQN